MKEREGLRGGRWERKEKGSEKEMGGKEGRREGGRGSNSLETKKTVRESSPSLFVATHVYSPEKRKGGAWTVQ